MRLDLAPETELFRDTARGFIERGGGIGAVRALAERGGGFDRAWWREAAELGWSSLLVPDEHGGAASMGGGVIDLAVIAEVMGEHACPGPLLPCNVVASAMATSGDRWQQERTLPGIASGELVAAWCPPGAGRVTATRTDGRLRLNGVACPIEAADQADWLLVTATLDDRPALVVLASDTPGVEVVLLESLDLVRHFAEVRFVDAVVPVDALVGEGDERALDRLLALGLVLQSAESTGAAVRVLAETVEYAFDRTSFGRPLASYQALKHRFADMRLWVESCQATSDAAAEAVAAGAPDALRLARIAKAYVADHAPEVIQDCIQVHGSIGVTWEHDLHLYLRRVTVNRAVLGSPAEQRRAIGREVSSREGTSDDR